MNNNFDGLTRSMAQSVTRRSAVKKFGIGFAAAFLVSIGLADKAEANPKGCAFNGSACTHNHDCCSRKCVPNSLGGSWCQA